MPFNLETFKQDCLSAVAEEDAAKRVTRLVGKAIEDPEEVYAELGKPDRGMIEKIYVSDELTIINVIWAPGMMIMPHNHNIWAVIGVYCGREDNIFWRRLEDDSAGRIEAAGAKSIGPGEAQPLGSNIIHSVANPTPDFTGAIHVYGGDFFAEERSEWDPQTLEEHPYNVDKNLKLFEDANAMINAN